MSTHLVQLLLNKPIMSLEGEEWDLITKYGRGTTFFLGIELVPDLTVEDCTGRIMDKLRKTFFFWDCQ